MAKASKYDSFHGDVCEALRNRAKVFVKATKDKERAITARDEAEESMDGHQEGTPEREKLDAEFGRRVREIKRASGARSWAIHEIVHLVENGDDAKLFQDVEIKAKPPKPKKDEDPAQLDLEEEADSRGRKQVKNSAD